MVANTTVTYGVESFQLQTEKWNHSNKLHEYCMILQSHSLSLSL